MIQDNSEDPIVDFKNIEEWEKWLDKNHATVERIWMRFYKKSSGVESINYAEALDVALCYGWIDGQAKSYDEKSWLQKFTPRRSKSIWSKRNIEHTERLIKLGKMQPAGYKQIELAKADGRWEKAYDSPSNMIMPDDFKKLLSKHKEAYDFFESLNKTNKYAILWRIQTAKKSETREKRMQTILEMLKNKKKFHP